jgi:DMSO reductase family type II enzyme chaperone
MTPATQTAAAVAEPLRFARAFGYPRADSRQADYHQAFDVDGSALYEGFHRPADGREGIFEDVMRFYDFFDLRLNDAERDYPDHLVTELEFLSYLAQKESEARARGADPAPFLRAQRDFIARHLGVWIPAFAARLEKAECASRHYADLAAELRAFVLERGRALEKELEGAKS